MIDQRPPSPRWPNWLTLVSAFAAYCALTLLATFPLVLNLRTYLPKDLGDPLIATSMLWWNAHAVPLTSAWWDGVGFFPMAGTMSFSEHFLGASLMATPLQWIGLDAVAAYNLTFLASFTLCAMAAHGLVWALTRRHDAALICGLAFGFNPFRIAHIEHLELLLAFGMPLALMALHRYVDCRRRKWLVVLSVALILQALSSSYYALFFTVFFGMWIVWFVHPHAWRDLLPIGTAGLVAILFVWPILAGYAGAHSAYNWRPDLAEEIRTFSADLSSFATASPLSALWGWTANMNGAERQLFPGFTISALAVFGLVWAIRPPGAGHDRWVMVSRMLWAAAALFASVAVAVKVSGPLRFDARWIVISAATSYKPLSTAAALAILALLATAKLRAAFRRRSILAFYLVAAAVLFLCSLGPEPTFFGERVLYEPPYAWLMRLPLFGDTVRAPARFAMLGVLALSVAASLAFHRVSRPGARRLLLGVVTIGIIFDGSMHAFPLARVPSAAFAIPPGARPAAVLELPLGDVWRDTAATYRSTVHGTRVVNGYNGFEPLAYQVLRRGLADRDPTILDALASFGSILIAVDKTADASRQIASFVSSHPRVRPLTEDGSWSLYWLARQPRPSQSRRCASGSIAIAAASTTRGAIDAAALTDQAPDTRWIAEEHSTDEPVVLDLGGARQPCSIAISMGAAPVYYPGSLEVATSIDGVTWHADFRGQMAGAAWLAALANPRDARMRIPLGRRQARFVRLRADQSSDLDPWAIADVVVR